MPRLPCRSLLAASILAAACTGAAADAPDGARLAAEHGCLNCHGELAHAAPAFKRLGERALQRGGDPAPVVDHLLEEMREKDAIHTHAFVSEARARAVLGWVAAGAK